MHRTRLHLKPGLPGSRSLVDNTLHTFLCIVVWKIEFTPWNSLLVAYIWFLSDFMAHASCHRWSHPVSFQWTDPGAFEFRKSPSSKSLSLGESRGPWHTCPSRHWQLIVTLMAHTTKQLSGGVTWPQSFSVIMFKSWERCLCQARNVFSTDLRHLSLPAWKLLFIIHSVESWQERAIVATPTYSDKLVHGRTLCSFQKYYHLWRFNIAKV